VLWLEINGPTATPALLMRLLGSVRNAASPGPATTSHPG
jgi:hypothetical protein